MVESFIDNIFVKFGEHLLCQVIGIPMSTNRAPAPLADLFLYTYESDFLDDMIRSCHRKLARSFNLCFRYIDDLIVFNNKKFREYVKDIYPSQRNVEKTNQSDDLASYLDLTFTTEKDGDFLQSYMTDVMTLISTLSIFHSCRVIYHLALLMVFTSRSSLDIHTMMISDIAIKR